MGKKDNQTSRTAGVQVFELTMDNPEDQDELNHRLHKPSEPDRYPTEARGREGIMYCPHCGREMALLEGVFTCDEGGMTLSRRLQEVLTQRFPAHRLRPAEATVGRKLTRWFCPGCGVPLGQEMRCPKCEQSIEDLLYTLVELHPHAHEK